MLSLELKPTEVEVGLLARGTVSALARYQNDCNTECNWYIEGSINPNISVGGQANVRAEIDIEFLDDDDEMVDFETESDVRIYLRGSTGGTLGFRYTDCEGWILSACFDGIFGDISLDGRISLELEGNIVDLNLGEMDLGFCWRYYVVCPFGFGDCSPPEECDHNCGDFFGAGGGLYTFPEPELPSLAELTGGALYTYKMTPTSAMEDYLLGNAGDFQPASGEEGVRPRARASFNSR